MPQSFRPYPEKGADIKGQFRLFKFLEESILLGGLHFGLLVPHFMLPFFIGYRISKGAGLWTQQVQYTVDAIIVPLLQGFSLGGVLIMGMMRFLTTEAKRVSNKRGEDAATFKENRSQLRVELALWSFIYLGFATILWQWYPEADGQGMSALKRTLARLQVGIDLGETWRPAKH